MVSAHYSYSGVWGSKPALLSLATKENLLQSSIKMPQDLDPVQKNMIGAFLETCFLVFSGPNSIGIGIIIVLKSLTIDVM